MQSRPIRRASAVRVFLCHRRAADGSDSRKPYRALSGRYARQSAVAGWMFLMLICSCFVVFHFIVRRELSLPMPGSLSIPGSRTVGSGEAYDEVCDN